MRSREFTNTVYFLLALAIVPDVLGIIWRSDISSADLEVADSKYPAVFSFGSETSSSTVLSSKGECTATLIDSQHALTAAHCLKNPSTGAPWTWAEGNFIVSIQGETYLVDKTYRNPCFSFSNDGPNGADLAILHLSKPVASITPYARYTGSDEVGTHFTMIGWGNHGPAGSTKPGSCSETADGCDKLREGENIFTSATQNTLQYTLLDPNGDDSEDVPQKLVIGYSGDSGGPGFISSGGVTYIAGINSGGNCCNYGSVDQMVRVSSAWSKEWIDKSIEDGESFASSCSSIGVSESDEESDNDSEDAFDEEAPVQELEDDNGRKGGKGGKGGKGRKKMAKKTRKRFSARLRKFLHWSFYVPAKSGWGRRRGKDKGPASTKKKVGERVPPKPCKNGAKGCRSLEMQEAKAWRHHWGRVMKSAKRTMREWGKRKARLRKARAMRRQWAKRWREQRKKCKANLKKAQDWQRRWAKRWHERAAKMRSKLKKYRHRYRELRRQERRGGKGGNHP